MSRILSTLLALSTLFAIGWHGYWVVPQMRLIPDSGRFALLFFGGLALPYLVTLGLLAWRDGRNGLRFALGAALVNAVWSLPLGAVLVLLGGFALGNRDQVQQILAVALGALLQLPLAAVAGGGLRRAPTAPAAAAPARGAWLLAFALPILASGASWYFYNWQLEAFKTRSMQLAANDRAAQETLKMLQTCLAAHRDRSYPSGLEACPDAAARTGVSSGFRFEYLPALPGADGRRGAYLLCAQPVRFRVTGFDTVVADATGIFGAGAAEQSPPDSPPTCASALGIERAIAWCAYQYASRQEDRGYPQRLADIRTCVEAGRPVRGMETDRVISDKGETYAYLADAPDAGGRIMRFRIYQLGLPGGGATWIDDQLVASKAQAGRAGPVVEGLPDAAVPERFEPGCAGGRGEDCFLAGHEWQRKAHQAGGKESEPPARDMNDAAVKTFERGCELDDSRSCGWLGHEVERGIHAERDVVRAAELFEKSCNLGRAEGCRNAGEMHETGRKARPQTLRPRPAPRVAKPDLPRDVARAVELYERACELGDRTACFIAARLLAAGEGITPDSGKAFALFARICDDGMASACSRAAAVSPERGKDYLRRGCVLGDGDACARAGR